MDGCYVRYCEQHVKLREFSHLIFPVKFEKTAGTQFELCNMSVQLLEQCIIWDQQTYIINSDQNTNNIDDVGD